ncbi:hypothetical protein GCM10023158_21150 [Gluconacetobacter tumulicola]|uniref:DUF2188 domain-containing protein n=2 Tax=Gluconacetobacter tumulicola TaxID=1017177 RepID=A0A7W4P8G1_9PROT|nr:DUF2188 domain-containing protein [Gluconacetobacter tumulicola]
MTHKDDLFVEQRSQGDYAVRRPNSERASHVASTQREAIDWANEHAHGGAVRIERVRRTSKGVPDHWRTE